MKSQKVRGKRIDFCCTFFMIKKLQKLTKISYFKNFIKMSLSIIRTF